MAKNKQVDPLLKLLLKEENPNYGLVSEYQKIPLFDKHSDMAHTFTHDIMERRGVEIQEAARKFGFIQTYKSKTGQVTFRKKANENVN